MKKTTLTSDTSVKARTRSGVAEASQSGVQAVSKGSLAVLGGVSTLIGLWAVACFVGGMISSGGPLALARSWFSAVTSM